METSLTEEEITPFVIMASAYCDVKFGTDSGYGEQLEEEIEKNLAAHFASFSRDPRVKSETVGPSDVVYFGQDGSGLKATPYGQNVLVLDYQGLFSSSGQTPGFGLEVLG